MTSQTSALVCRGVRGAITADANTEEAILAATRELLGALADQNGILPADIAGIWFTTTPDLTAAFPAKAARQIGWTDVAMLGAHEIDVPGALPRCIRVLLLWNTLRPPEAIHHVYLREARRLRPDWAGEA